MISNQERTAMRTFTEIQKLVIEASASDNPHMSFEEVEWHVENILDSIEVLEHAFRHSIIDQDELNELEAIILKEEG